MPPSLNRIVPILAVLSFGCQGIRSIGETEFTDPQREKRFKVNPAKLAVLRRAANDRLSPQYRDNPKLLKHYDYWPKIVDHRFRGLWHFDNYSHLGPLLVINGKHTATVVPVLNDKAAGLDSLNVALRKYPLAEIGPEIRDSIVKSFEFMYR